MKWLSFWKCKAEEQQSCDDSIKVLPLSEHQLKGIFKNYNISELRDSLIQFSYFTEKKTESQNLNDTAN